MWLMTQYGFFSIVCAYKLDEKGKPTYERDPATFMVRARLRQNLEALLKRFGNVLGDPKIVEGSYTDYRYRIIVPKEKWIDVAVDLTEEITYGNFKSQVAKNPENIDSGYEHALHDVWDTMYGLQTKEGTRKAKASLLKTQALAGRGYRPIPKGVGRTVFDKPKT